MNYSKIQLTNGLQVSVDWLSFTFKDFSLPERVVSLLGYQMEDFAKMPRGGMGYKAMLKSRSGISILYDGNDNMGVHVVVSGSAVSDLLEHFMGTRSVDTPFGIAYDIPIESTCLAEFLSMVLKYGSFSRIDLAVDDIGGQYFSLDDLVYVLDEKRYVSKFRSWRNVCEKTVDGQKTGHTIYMGQRSSAIMLRVYDKRLEQNKKAADTGEKITSEWIRWELELHNERAIQTVSQLASGKGLGDVCVGVLGHYIRLIELDNANKSRCSINSQWARFLDGIAPLRLYIAKVGKTLADSRRWIERQVAPTLTAIVAADGGSIDYLEKVLHLGRYRLSKHHLDMIAAENPFCEVYGI